MKLIYILFIFSLFSCGSKPNVKKDKTKKLLTTEDFLEKGLIAAEDTFTFIDERWEKADRMAQRKYDSLELVRLAPALKEKRKRDSIISLKFDSVIIELTRKHPLQHFYDTLFEVTTEESGHEYFRGSTSWLDSSLYEVYRIDSWGAESFGENTFSYYKNGELVFSIDSSYDCCKYDVTFSLNKPLYKKINYLHKGHDSKGNLTFIEIDSMSSTNSSFKDDSRFIDEYNFDEYKLSKDSSYYEYSIVDTIEGMLERNLEPTETFSHKIDRYIYEKLKNEEK